jgi:hypothetical protein
MSAAHMSEVLTLVASNFKPKGGPNYRCSVGSETGKHIEGKKEAEALGGLAGALTGNPEYLHLPMAGAHSSGELD